MGNGFLWRKPKKVIQLSNPEGLPLRIYNSILQAAVHLRHSDENIKKQSQTTCETAIVNCLHKRQKTALGYKWAYFKENINHKNKMI